MERGCSRSGAASIDEPLRRSVVHSLKRGARRHTATAPRGSARTRRAFPTCGDGVDVRTFACKSLQTHRTELSTAGRRCRASRTLLCSPLLLTDRRSGAAAWSSQRELTADEPVERGLRSARRGAQRDDLPHLVRPRRPVARCPTTAFVAHVPNDFTREWIEGHFLGLIRRSCATSPATSGRVHLATRRARASGTAGGGGRERAPPRPRRARPSRPEPEVHVRLVRDRLVEPLRPRGRARRRRGAGAGLQPALHLRRHRARQDAPAAGDRASTSPSTRAT